MRILKENRTIEPKQDLPIKTQQVKGEVILVSETIRCNHFSKQWLKTKKKKKKKKTQHSNGIEVASVRDDIR
ncbi:hypothetical protein BLOT_016391 [Blomia tropicalis]|nr:hypothetical protein BLOT_016391 [Blomia tropicalis]